MAGKGRPGKYETHVAPYLNKISEMALTMTEEQIAKTLGVGYTAFKRYKQQYPQLVDCLKKGRNDLVFELRSALIKKAKGYEYTETKVTSEQLKMDKPMRQALIDAGFKADDLDKVQIVKTEVAHKKMAPDVAALNLALKNYDKDNWANDPQSLELKKKELELKERQVESNEW